MKKIVLVFLLTLLCSVALGEQFGVKRTNPTASYISGYGIPIGTVSERFCVQTADDTTPSMGGGAVYGGCNVLLLADNNSATTTITSLDDLTNSIGHDSGGDYGSQITIIGWPSSANPSCIDDGNDFVLERQFCAPLGSNEVRVLLLEAQMVRAQGTVTLTGQPTAGQTMIVDTVTLTARASGATTNEFNIGGTVAITATNMATAINSYVTTVGATAFNDGTNEVVLVEYDTLGVSGNSVVFSEAMTNIAMDGAGFLGGSRSGDSLIFVEKGRHNGIRYFDDQMLVEYGTLTDFPDAQMVVGKSDTGNADSNQIGVVGEAAAVASGDTAFGVYGWGETASNRAAVGVKGQATVAASSNTGIAYGLVGVATDTHAGSGADGVNVALNVEASGATLNNYAIQIAAGDIDSTTPAVDWDLKDNDSSALSFDTTGLAGICEMKTTNGEETLNTTAKFTQTGANLDAASGDEVAVNISYTTNKATSGDDYGIKLRQTNTLSPGTSYLYDFGVGTASQSYLTNTGIWVLYGSSQTDSLTVYHDETDVYFKTLDGNYIFQTDEGTNTKTKIELKPKGSSEISEIGLYDTNTQNLYMYTAANRAYIESQNGALGLQGAQVQNILLWESIASGNPSLVFYGWNTAGGDTETTSLIMDDTNDEFLIQSANSANHEGVTVDLLEGNQRFRIREGSDVFSVQMDGTNALVKWSDGNLIMSTDEGTNTASVVEVKPKGTSEVSSFGLYDTDGQRLYAYTAADRAYIESQGGALGLQNAQAQNVYVWEGITSGNPYMYWYGWDGGTSAKQYLRASVDATGDALFETDSGDIIFLPSGAGDFSDKDINNVGDIELDSLTGDSTAGISIGGTGATSEERIAFVFGATSNNIDVSTSTSATDINFTALDINTTTELHGEHILSDDDAVITDNLTAGDIAISEAAGAINFSGNTSATISTTSTDLTLDPAGNDVDLGADDNPVDANIHSGGEFRTYDSSDDFSFYCSVTDGTARWDCTGDMAVSGAFSAGSMSMSGDIDMNQNDLIDAASVVVATAKGGLATWKTASQTLTFSGGGGDASQTTSGLVPPGSTLMSIMTRVITVATGCVTYDVGDGTDGDIFGNDISAIIDGNTSTPANFTANVANPQLAGGEVKITGNVNCIDLVVRVVATYVDYTAETTD